MMFKPFALMTSVIAMTAIAAPNDMALQKRAETEILASNIEFAVQAADCSLLGCATVAASSVCIAAAILKRDPVNLVSCVAGDVGALCSCAGCVPQLGDFLEDQRLC
ncbi:hypothetical protein SLS56_012085 [Neofusicoccum ribis]|uniref:Fungal calcium binding protein domain-containing protein n=1 Tax=Neofusicoccum ribis TaxID=45134 RepID=A0ABR3S9U3_9PEZI